METISRFSSEKNSVTSRPLMSKIFVGKAGRKSLKFSLLRIFRVAAIAIPTVAPRMRAKARAAMRSILMTFAPLDAETMRIRLREGNILGQVEGGWK
jgi:hypothetical protein